MSTTIIPAQPGFEFVWKLCYSEHLCRSPIIAWSIADDGCTRPVTSNCIEDSSDCDVQGILMPDGRVHVRTGFGNGSHFRNNLDEFHDEADEYDELLAKQHLSSPHKEKEIAAAKERRKARANRAPKTDHFAEIFNEHAAQ